MSDNIVGLAAVIMIFGIPSGWLYGDLRADRACRA
jgi:hypothetical protein